MIGTSLGGFGIFYALLALSFLIFIHELGHFLAARFFGVKVEVFSICFGKRFLTKKIGETEYSLSAIPLGGYVRMKGQDDLNPLSKSGDGDSYSSKKPWQRIIMLLAGPFANFILAFFLYFTVSNMGILSLSPVVGKVMSDSVAFHANLQTNDTIKEINGKTIRVWSDIGGIIEKSNGELSLIIQRENKLLSINLTPKNGESENIFREKIQKKMIGISPSGQTHIEHYRGFNAIVYAFKETYRASILILQSLQKFITGVLSPKELGGVVAIVDVSSDFAKAGIVPFLMLVAMISVNLGVLNLLPIPALDGGHIIFNIYEWIFKKPPSEKVFYNLTILGWVLLLTLMIFVTYNDIVRLLNK
jgi:regulator of sigma E protease